MARERSRAEKYRLKAERAENRKNAAKAEELKQARRAAGAAIEGNGRRNGHEPLALGWFCPECGRDIPLSEAEAHEAGLDDRRLDCPHQDLAAITGRSRPWYETEAWSRW
jgi:hypothetical protein